MAAGVKGPASAPAGALRFKEAKRFEHDRELLAARFSPCGKFLFAGSYDGRVYRWDVTAGTKTALAGHHGWIQGLVFHPDGKRLFTGDSWGGICCWDYADESPAPKWARTDGHSRWMRSLAISPVGALLATCGADRVTRLWSTDDGSPAWESPVQPDDLLCVAFHPAGRSLLVGDLKGNVTDWSVEERRPLRKLDAAAVLYLRPLSNGTREINDVGGVRAIAFEPEGKFVACAGSQPATSGFFTGKPTVVLLDWTTGERKRLWQWENADPAEGIVLDVAWNPAGYFMAASSGQPGKGALACWKPGDATPMHVDKTLAHSRGVSLHPEGGKLAVTQVLIKSGQQAGNGRRVNKDGEYVGLVAQVRVYDVVAATS